MMLVQIQEMTFKFLPQATGCMGAPIHQDGEQNERSMFRVGNDEFCLDLSMELWKERVLVPALAVLSRGTS